jgi:hypothetical protein
MGKWSDLWSRSSLKQQTVRVLDNAGDEKTRSIVLTPLCPLKVKVARGKSRVRLCSS